MHNLTPHQTPNRRRGFPKRQCAALVNRRLDMADRRIEENLRP